MSSANKKKSPKSKPKLTTSQEKAFEALQAFIVKGDSKYFKVIGYAGTGKSFLMVHLMYWLLGKNITFVAGSPTNKASKNLEKLANDANLDIRVTTIARLLGLQPTLNVETGQEEFIQELSPTIDAYNVAILDEMSMISKSNFQEIERAVVVSNTKIIFVGDRAQLPPVGEREPIVALTSMPQVELTEIVRYDGEIGKVAEEIRSNTKYNRFLYPFQTTKDRTIICLPRPEWLSKAAEYFNSSDYMANTDFCRILVWRNKTADFFNQWIREQLWGDNVPDFVKGDRLIAKKPVFRKSDNPNKKGKNAWDIYMNSSEECEIVDDPKLLYNYKDGLYYWDVLVAHDEGYFLRLRILNEESELKRQELLTHYKENKIWNRYYFLEKQYDYCSCAYAITTHKAQGSSINNVFLYVQDMGKCWDLQKIQYTALTRAKSSVFICK